MKRARILIIDDSSTARAALRAALGHEAALEVVGEAADGAAARRLIERLAPDLITMDVFLRAENGLDLAASIMARTARPIVMVTAADVRDPSLVFRALQAGALDVCAKLPGPTHPDYGKRRAQLVRMLKTLASVPVVHRPVLGARAARSQLRVVSAGQLPSPLSRVSPAGDSTPMLLLGASTGGPPLLSKLLRALPKPFPLPIALVQHMISGFVPGFAAWLAQDTGHAVSLLSTSCVAKPGVVYLPAAEHHLVLETGARIGVSCAAPHGLYRPSVDVLFESAAGFAGASKSIALILTGMGTDGASGLRSLRRAGALTIAQDPQTCAVASMPAHAIELDAAERVLRPEQLSVAITTAATSLAAGNRF